MQFLFVKTILMDRPLKGNCLLLTLLLISYANNTDKKQKLSNIVLLFSWNHLFLELASFKKKLQKF